MCYLIYSLNVYLTFKAGVFFKMNSESKGTSVIEVLLLSFREEKKPENIFDTNLPVAKKEGLCF